MSSRRRGRTGSTRPTPICAARIVFAAPASGSGKTTIAIGVMRALVARGLSVAPFKIGPDYIDPSHHRVAAGRPARSLDTWLLSSEAVMHVFARGSAGTDIAIIEGVMGLFDDRAGPSPNGSTAEVATLLRAPIVLVIDAYRLGDGRTEGVRTQNVLASYVHVHLGSDPRLAERLVNAATAR